jgi:hypothetical protein
VVLSGEDGISGGRAGRGGDVGLVEQNPFTGHPVESRSLNHRVAVDPCVGPSPVIGYGKKDVGGLWSFLLAGKEAAQSK